MGQKIFFFIKFLLQFLTGNGTLLNPPPAQKNAILEKMFEYGHFSKCDYYITYIPSKMPQTSKRLQKLVYGSIYNAWSLSLSHVSATPLQCSEDDKIKKRHSLTH